MHKKEVFKGNTEKAKEYFIETLYYQITKSAFHIDADYSKNRKEADVEEIIKRNQKLIDKYGISTENIIDFYFKRSDTIV